MALSTIGDYVTQARVLLQDTQSVKRYTDGELKDALGVGLYEMRRLRPDLFPGGAAPDYGSSTGDGTAVALDVQYRMALLHYMAAHMYMREEEEGAQQLARAYKQVFGSQLVSLAV